MCRLLGYVADQPVSVVDVLGEDGFERFTALTAVHGDGWGMAWQAEDRSVRSVAVPGSASADPAYEGLARKQLGRAAVVWSAGAGGGEPARTYAVDRDAAIRSVAAAETAGVGRYVMVSYFYRRPEHGVPPDSSFFPYAEAKAAADSCLRESALAWTVLGPSRLTDATGTGRIEVAEAGPSVGPASAGPSSVSRDDVAAVAAYVLEQPATIGRTIDFNNGALPVADAL